MYDIKINSFSFSSYSNILINSVDGVCPPSATISTKKMGKDGTTFQGSTKNERNIVINFSILHNVKETRKIMYSKIIPGDEVNIVIDGLTTIGYIENLMINNFEKLTNGQISIICPNPYFYGNENTLSVTKSVKTFDSDIVNDYILEVNFNSGSTSYNYTLNGKTYIVNYNFQSGDTLIIDTLNRKITRNNNNIYGSKSWIEWGLIKSGENKIAYAADGTTTSKLKYKDRYLGI